MALPEARAALVALRWEHHALMWRPGATVTWSWADYNSKRYEFCPPHGEVAIPVDLRERLQRARAKAIHTVTRALMVSSDMSQASAGPKAMRVVKLFEYRIYIASKPKTEQRRKWLKQQIGLVGGIALAEIDTQDFTILGDRSRPEWDDDVLPFLAPEFIQLKTLLDNRSLQDFYNDNLPETIRLEHARKLADVQKALQREHERQREEWQRGRAADLAQRLRDRKEDQDKLDAETSARKKDRKDIEQVIQADRVVVTAAFGRVDASLAVQGQELSEQGQELSEHRQELAGLQTTSVTANARLTTVEGTQANQAAGLDRLRADQERDRNCFSAAQYAALEDFLQQRDARAQTPIMRSPVASTDSTPRQTPAGQRRMPISPFQQNFFSPLNPRYSSAGAFQTPQKRPTRG